MTMKSAAQRHQHARVGVTEGVGGQPDAREPAEQQPSGRQRTRDEALPVARHGVGQDERGPAASRAGSRGAPRRVGGLPESRGSGTTLQHVGGQVPDLVVVPGRAQPEVVEEPGDHAGREAPQSHVAVRARSGSRPDPAATGVGR